MEKNRKPSWKGFSILLIIVNLVNLALGWFIIYFGLVGYLLLLYVLIIDCFAFMSYVNEESPPWRGFFLYLLVVNALFFFMAFTALSAYMGAMSGFFIFPIALPLVIIDLISVLSYIAIQKPKGVVKDISYIVMIPITLVLLYVAYTVYSIVSWHNDFSLIFLNPFFIIGLFIVATLFLVILYFRQKPRK